MKNNPPQHRHSLRVEAVGDLRQLDEDIGRQ
jgi:hypothetical protein